jgi:N-acetylglutamate synthase-like GNAT family acetyltransferase
MVVTIRRASSEDIDTLVRIIRTAYSDVADRFGLTSENAPTHPSNCQRGWVQSDLARGVSYFLLERGGAPCGCVALELASTSVAYLERLAVVPCSRRQGLGARLVEHALHEATVAGVTTVSVGVIAEQVELTAWYEKLGFVQSGTSQTPHLPFTVRFLECRLRLRAGPEGV